MKTKFAVNVRQWAEKTGLKTEQVVRAATLEIFSRVILKSPVDTGRFRGNWQVDRRGFDWEKNDKTGSVTIEKVTADVMASEVGGVTSLINNLPYAERLEFGHSKQAPEGMVRLTAKEFVAVVEEAASKERR